MKKIADFNDILANGKAYSMDMNSSDKVLNID